MPPRPPILAYAEPELISSAIDNTSVHSNIDRLLLESKIQGYQRGGPAENGPKTYDTGTESEKYFEDVEIPDKYRKGILNLFNIAQNPVVEVHTPQTLFQTLRERQPLKFEGQTFDEEHAKYMPEGMFFSGAEESIPDTIRYMGSQHAPAIASEIGHGLLERYPELGNLFLSGEQPTQEIMDKILSGQSESGRTSNVQEAINREKKLETDRMESYKDLQSVEGFTHEGIEPFIYDYLRKSASGYQDGGPAERPPVLGYLESAVSDRPHSNIDRLILEDKMDKDPLSGLVQKPQHSISVPREYHPEDALPIGGMLRGGKGALAMLKHSYGPYAKQAAHYRNILDKKLMKILKKYESQTRGRSIEKSLSTGAGQEATQEAMETDFIIQKLRGKYPIE